MSADAVLTVDLPAELPSAWLEVATIVHAADPRWLGQDEAALRRDASAHNPWFRSGRARAFCVPGKARLTAYFEPSVQLEGHSAAYFGDLYTTGDEQAERALFEAARAWVSAQGARQWIGPIHFNTHFDYRLLLSMEPDGLPFPGEPYNTAAAPRCLERLGFTLAQRYCSQLLDGAGLSRAADQCAGQARRALAAGYSTRDEPIEHFLEALPDFYEANLAIFRDAFAYAPLPKAVWIGAVSQLLVRACPHTSGLSRDDTGKVVAFLLCFPHWGPLLKQGAQERVTVEQLRYETHAPRLGAQAKMVLKSLGVSPEHRQAGLGGLLMHRAFAVGAERYAGGIAALIREDNPSGRYGGGAHFGERHYALYGAWLQK